MKLGAFVVAAVCLTTSFARANDDLDRAAARSRSRDHAGAIELYRSAYERQSDPHVLVLIAHEYRRAGDAQQALAYFCSYMYVDAAGPHADDASAHARTLSATLGVHATSDHEACSPRARRQTAAPRADVVATTVQPRRPLISKREVVGLVVLGGSVASLALALREAGTLRDLREDLDAATPGAEQNALEDRERSAQRRQKLYLGAGGAALITGGLLYVLGRADRRKADRALIAPTVSKTGAGLVLGRRF